MTRQEAFAIISGAPIPPGGFFGGPDYEAAIQAVGAVRREFVAAIALAHQLGNTHPSLPKACGVLATIDERLAGLLAECRQLDAVN
jgi:hypothetical protein